ncbi:MAG TPA: carbon starvation CstA family protein [Tepidisphaeraceae bacterium]|jgi:carbon starvation protein
MTVLPIVVASAVVLALAYRWYAPLVMKWLGADPRRPTPAVTRDDGLDFVPAPAGVVLGGHFTAIAAAGPVVGPILAALAFGWGPALVWILLGSIFIGSVHDAGTLMASLRHNAGSITQVVREHMSRGAYYTFLVFVWMCLIYVIIAFTDVTAGTFAAFTPVIESGRDYSLNGGAVAIGATAYLVLSVALGLLLRFTRTPWWAGLIVCALGLAATIALAPAAADYLAGQGWSFLSTKGKGASLQRGWDMALLVYCFIASVTPMWLLLQPRGVIGATFLYAALFFGVLGTLLGGWNPGGELAIEYPMFKGFQAEKLGYLFPMLFITIACGACSGFHSIVASGTTCKQVRSEGDVKPIAFGAMLLEAMVAVFSVACVMMLPANSAGGTPDVVYAKGMAVFQNVCGIPLQFALGFGLLAFSSFVFDTLDVCTRLGRYVLQELTGLRGLGGGAAATLITLCPPALYLWKSEPGSFKTFWTIFGTSNQLLAALTLVGISVWLWRTGRPVWFALVPAVLMLATTATALVLNVNHFLRSKEVRVDGVLRRVAPSTMDWTNAAIAVALLLLAVYVAIEAARMLVRSRRGDQAAAAL